MKKSLFIGLVAVLGLIGCSRNQEINVPDANLSIFARTESPAETKTVVESGVHVYWEPGDEIAVFTGEKSANFTTDITAASGTATFKGTFGDSSWPKELDLWAVYPYSEDAVFDGETITTTLPSEQVAREGSFGKDMNLAVAHSTGTTLQFYNVGGGIRFSVTQEGIKKVMFEGLSGEIISGKVKIGFSEDGKPEVKEVTGGSQFITLLPPEGYETFQKDTWYYIVAIPGSLESGFKLRFYKDSDYARRVSEKAVQIKRSIYGSIEKADEGIEFEPQTTHFPETKEELVESAKLTEEITSTLIPCISSIVEEMGGEIIDVETICERLLRIEGIEEATVYDNNDVILIKQKDGVHLNVLLHTFLDDGEIPEESANQSIGETPKQKARQATIENRSIPNSKKAIILAPIQFHCKAQLSNIKSYLNSVGYSVDCFENEAADITKFKASFLEKYDVILIESHGGTGCFSPSGKTLFNSDSRSVIFSGTKYHYDNFDAWIDNWFGDWGVSSEFFSIFTTDAVIGVSKDGTYLAMTVDDLEGGSFDNAFVFLVACESAAYLTGDQSFIKSFIDKGAGAVLGFNKTIDIWYGNDFLELLVDGMTQGLCLSVASTYIKTLPYMWNSDNRDSFVYKKANDERYYLVNPYPYDLKSNVDGNSVTIEFSHVARNSYFEYSIYVDDVFKQKGSPNSRIKIDNLSEGKHKWSVIADYYLNGEHFATYRTDSEDFTVNFQYAIPEAIDLGLPSGTKWASFNLGATKPEGYGYCYAWGETEPKSDYSWETYKWCRGSGNTLTKYCAFSEYGYNGFVDNKQVLDPEDDAAHVNLSGNWRMPTEEDFHELLDYCTLEWVKENGVNGRKVTGPNGNSIFLPAADEANQTVNLGQGGHYLSLSLSSYYEPSESFIFYFDWSAVSCTSRDRFHGYSIRPVYGDPNVRAAISSYPNEINYGDVKVGEGLGNETGRVTFNNTGKTDLSIRSIWCTEGFSHSPSLTFPIVLSPGDSKTITFAFKPTEVKKYSGYITIYSNAWNSPYFRVKMTGNGVE